MNTHVEHSYSLGDQIDALARLRWNYWGAAPEDFRDELLNQRDSFSTFDMELGFSLENGRTNIMLWAKNLTDRFYHGNSFEAPEQAGRINAYVDNRRTFGLNITITVE